MTVQHTFQIPEGVTVHAFDDFPDWEIALYRSEDGTPVVDLITGGADHDADGVPFVRIYVNEGEVHEHMTAAAARWRDRSAAAWAAFLDSRHQRVNGTAGAADSAGTAPADDVASSPLEA